MPLRHSERLPLAAAFVALFCWGFGGTCGWALGELTGAPVALHLLFVAVGYGCGHLLGRSALRRMFVAPPPKLQG